MAEDIPHIERDARHPKGATTSHKLERKPARRHSARHTTPRTPVYRAGHIIHPATVLIGQYLMGLLNGLELLLIATAIRMLLAGKIFVGATNLLLRRV
jgi:hypothetical protein